TKPGNCAAGRSRCPPNQEKSMYIREYHENDLPALGTIHAAQGFDYAFPDLSAPLFITKIVLTDDAPTPGNVNVSSSWALDGMNLPIGDLSESGSCKIQG